MSAENYFGINNFVAQQHLPSSVTLESLSKSYEYIISQEREAYSGTLMYNYPVFDASIKGTQIEFNGWIITRIYTEPSDRIRAINFSITDPSGVASKNLQLVSVLRTDEEEIAFPGSTVETLNNGLAFFKKLSKYRNWKDYLNSDLDGEVVTKASTREKIVKDQNEMRIRKLEEENEALKNKISQISSILSKTLEDI